MSNNFGVVEIASKRMTSAPGWAYVPDLGPAAAAAAAGSAAGGRKRAARNLPGLSAHDQGAREEARVAKELQALDREGNRDATIAVPASTGRAVVKHTPNVRRILQSQKTFANHLNDFEAHLAQEPDGNASSGSAAAAVGANTGTSTGSSGPTAKRSKRASLAAAAATRASAEAAEALKRRASHDADTAGGRGRVSPGKIPPGAVLAQNSEGEADAGAGSADGSTDAEANVPETTAETADNAWSAAPRKHPRDDDPLLESWVPTVPGPEELARLLAVPPRNYFEMRAVWTAADARQTRYPVRVFCEVCGYWGKVRCVKCGVRVCALNCLNVHREECITRYGL
ncbi:hypothetical protein BROUX41_004797 [Berkeleyomyces rouxiae]|uniref:uncharacterized protein n=1 Tax=Berkeleyomyces rouxiae TaxID=2035830 RepID=UPI003B7743FB